MNWQGINTDRKIQKHEQAVLGEDLTLGESLVQVWGPAFTSVSSS